MKRVSGIQHLALMTMIAGLGFAEAAYALSFAPPWYMLERLAGKANLCIQAGNGHFFSVDPTDTKRVLAQRKVCGSDEIFRVLRAGDGLYAIYNVAQKTYLSCQPDGRLEGNRTQIGEWEKFKFDGELRGDRNRLEGRREYVFQLQCVAHPKRFVVAEGNGGGIVSAKSLKAGDWETFRIALKGRETMKPFLKSRRVKY